MEQSAHGIYPTFNVRRHVFISCTFKIVTYYIKPIGADFVCVSPVNLASTSWIIRPIMKHRMKQTITITHCSLGDFNQNVDKYLSSLFRNQCIFIKLPSCDCHWAALMISQWQQQAISWDVYRHIASLSHNESTIDDPNRWHIYTAGHKWGIFCILSVKSNFCQGGTIYIFCRLKSIFVL